MKAQGLFVRSAPLRKLEIEPTRVYPRIFVAALKKTKRLHRFRIQARFKVFYFPENLFVVQSG